MDTLTKKYGSEAEAYERIEKYVNEQRPEIIMRDNNTRDVMQSMSIDDVKRYLYSTEYMQNKPIYDAITTMDTKMGKPGYGKDVIKEYLRTGNENLITRTNSARDIITSADKNQLARIIGE